MRMSELPLEETPDIRFFLSVFPETETMNAVQKVAAQCLACGLAVFVAGVILGLLVAPTQPRESAALPHATLAAVFVNGVRARAVEIPIKGITILLLMMLAAQRVAAALGIHGRLRDLASHMAKEDHNDSAAILLGGALTAIALVVCMLPFTSLASYTMFLLAKGGFALVSSVVTSAVMLWWLGMAPSGQVERLLRASGTEAAAVTIAGSLVAAALFTTVV